MREHHQRRRRPEADGRDDRRERRAEGRGAERHDPRVPAHTRAAIGLEGGRHRWTRAYREASGIDIPALRRTTAPAKRVRRAGARRIRPCPMDTLRMTRAARYDKKDAWPWRWTRSGASGGRDLRPMLPSTFEVICAGEAVWNVAAPGSALSAASLKFTPGGGAVRTSVELAHQGVRVGLAAAFADDTFGRTLRERVATAGVDVGAVVLTPPETNLVFVDGFGASQQLMAFREEEQPLSVPLAWSSQVLLLSGMSPALTYGAALCKARAGRRADCCGGGRERAASHLERPRFAGDPRAAQGGRRGPVQRRGPARAPHRRGRRCAASSARARSC